MNVLIVDDWQNRHLKIKSAFNLGGRYSDFRDRYSPTEVTIEDLEWADVVFLDHDMCKAPEGLGCPNPCRPGTSANFLDEGCGCPTGMDLVNTMTSKEGLKKLKCVVHTANPTGGKNMAQSLFGMGFPTAWSPVPTWDNLLPSTLFKLWKI